MSEFEPRRFGKYLLLGRLAHGGMAELYRAKLIGAEGFEKLIAIKMILPHLAEEENLIKSFIEEAKLAAYLQHQNIVQIYDFGSVDGAYYIAMEYLYGKDLKLVIKRAKEKKAPLSLEMVLYIATQVCAGLAYAHKLKDFQGRPLNIIHRDIGPQNVFVTYDGQVKIIDFGIAKAAIQDTTTQEGSIKGKVAYMSPEQAQGKVIDHRSDLFAMGILLYEMATRKKMFEGDAFQVFAKVREADYTPPEVVKSDLPMQVYRILEKALKKDREQRYQSAEEMLADLEVCIQQLSFSSSFRGLSQYMNELFKKEAESDVHVMEEAEDFDLSAVTGQDETRSTRLEKTLLLTETIEPLKKKKRLFPYAALVLVLLIGGTSATLIYSNDPSILVDKLQQNAAFLFWQKKLSHKQDTDPTVQKNHDEISGVNESYSTFKPIQDPSPVHDSPAMKEGIRLLKEERYIEAAVIFEDILMTGPSVEDRVYVLYSNALVGQAVTLFGSDPEKAKALLLKAVKLVPGNPQGHFHLGRIYTRQKDYTSAIASYQTALELDPQMPGAYFNLGYIYASKKEYIHAEAMFGRAVELSPQFLDEALYNLALVQRKLGKHQACINHLERAISINPDNEHAKRLFRDIGVQNR
ncbi:MAG: protein kinase [Deltaproteobacteria bacterium]|nr:protein kinase [Deltaproteobacteria bacterium]